MTTEGATVCSDGYAAPMEPELARYYETLSRGVAAISGPDPDLTTMRRAAREARLAISPSSAQPAGTPFKGATLQGRVFRPRVVDPDVPLPLIIYLHGGGWTILDTETHSPLMQAYADAAGWMVLGLDYPLAPETRFPEIGQDCEREILHVAGTAGRIGADPKTLVLAGDSCGANLALSVAMSLGGRMDSLRALLLNYPVLDSDLARPSYMAFGAAPYLLTREKMEFFWSSYCASEADRTNPRAAPCRAPDEALSALPPTYLAVAAQDVLFDENWEFANRLDTLGVDTTMHVYDAAGHGFVEAVEHSPIARRAVADAAGWLAGRHT